MKWIIAAAVSALAGAAWLFRGFIQHQFAPPGWHIDYVSENEAHVWPCRDEQPHTASEDCICGIQTVPVERDGSYGWIYKHTAYDGRE
jgi:hypothetical protein